MSTPGPQSIEEFISILLTQASNIKPACTDRPHPLLEPFTAHFESDIIIDFALDKLMIYLDSLPQLTGSLEERLLSLEQRVNLIYFFITHIAYELNPANENHQKLLQAFVLYLAKLIQIACFQNYKNPPPPVVMQDSWDTLFAYKRLLDHILIRHQLFERYLYANESLFRQETILYFKSNKMSLILSLFSADISFLRMASIVEGYQNDSWDEIKRIWMATIYKQISEKRASLDPAYRDNRLFNELDRFSHVTLTNEEEKIFGDICQNSILFAKHLHDATYRCSLNSSEAETETLEILSLLSQIQTNLKLYLKHNAENIKLLENNPEFYETLQLFFRIILKLNDIELQNDFENVATNIIDRCDEWYQILEIMDLPLARILQDNITSIKGSCQQALIFLFEKPVLDFHRRYLQTHASFDELSLQEIETNFDHIAESFIAFGQTIEPEVYNTVNTNCVRVFLDRFQCFFQYPQFEGKLLETIYEKLAHAHSLTTIDDIIYRTNICYFVVEYLAKPRDISNELHHKFIQMFYSNLLSSCEILCKKFTSSNEVYELLYQYKKFMDYFYFYYHTFSTFLTSHPLMFSEAFFAKAQENCINFCLMALDINLQLIKYKKEKISSAKVYYERLSFEMFYSDACRHLADLSGFSHEQKRIWRDILQELKCEFEKQTDEFLKFDKNTYKSHINIQQSVKMLAITIQKQFFALFQRGHHNIPSESPSNFSQIDELIKNASILGKTPFPNLKKDIVQGKLSETLLNTITSLCTICSEISNFSTLYRFLQKSVDLFKLCISIFPQEVDSSPLVLVSEIVRHFIHISNFCEESMELLDVRVFAPMLTVSTSSKCAAEAAMLTAPSLVNESECASSTSLDDKNSKQKKKKKLSKGSSPAEINMILDTEAPAASALEAISSAIEPTCESVAVTLQPAPIDAVLSKDTQLPPAKKKIKQAKLAHAIVAKPKNNPSYARSTKPTSTSRRTTQSNQTHGSQAKTKKPKRALPLVSFIEGSQPSPHTPSATAAPATTATTTIAAITAAAATPTTCIFQPNLVKTENASTPFTNQPKSLEQPETLQKDLENLTLDPVNDFTETPLVLNTTPNRTVEEYIFQLIETYTAANLILPPETQHLIHQHAHLIEKLPLNKRLSDLAKLFLHGRAILNLNALIKYRLFHYLFPTSLQLNALRTYSLVETFLKKKLREIDAKSESNRKLMSGREIAALLLFGNVVTDITLPFLDSKQVSDVLSTFCLGLDNPDTECFKRAAELLLPQYYTEFRQDYFLPPPTPTMLVLYQPIAVIPIHYPRYTLASSAAAAANTPPLLYR